MLTRNAPGPDEFAIDFARSMREFAEVFFLQMAPACPPDNLTWRAEVCAALWAATQAVFDSSVLAPSERKDLVRAITRKPGTLASATVISSVTPSDKNS